MAQSISTASQQIKPEKLTEEFRIMESIFNVLILENNLYIATR